MIYFSCNQSCDKGKKTYTEFNKIQLSDENFTVEKLKEKPTLPEIHDIQESNENPEEEEKQSNAYEFNEDKYKSSSEDEDEFMEVI